MPRKEQSEDLTTAGPKHRRRPQGRRQSLARAMEGAERICDQRELRLTPIRRRILELVWERHAPIGAYEILGTLKRGGRAAVGPPTVYRVLEFLLEANLIHRIEPRNAFIACQSPGRSCRGNRGMCVACQRVAERADTPTIPSFRTKPLAEDSDDRTNMANKTKRREPFPESRGAHDHSRCRARALRIAERICAERKLQLTLPRRRILELVWERHAPIGAYDILGSLKNGDGPAMAPASVYRALEFLLDAGLIHRIDALNAFVGCEFSAASHVAQFLICSNCQRVIELEDNSIVVYLRKKAQVAGFAPEAKQVEITGTCTQCRRNATSLDTTDLKAKKHQPRPRATKTALRTSKR